MNYLKDFECAVRDGNTTLADPLKEVPKNPDSAGWFVWIDILQSWPIGHPVLLRLMVKNHGDQAVDLETLLQD